jgi:hypothetical protein
VKDDIKALWLDSGIKSVYKRSSEYHLLDSCTYFMADVNIDRVFAPEFMPTLNDILRCRLATTGIIQKDFYIAASGRSGFTASTTCRRSCSSPLCQSMTWY